MRRHIIVLKKTAPANKVKTTRVVHKNDKETVQLKGRSGDSGRGLFFIPHHERFYSYWQHSCFGYRFVRASNSACKKSNQVENGMSVGEKERLVMVIVVEKLFRVEGTT